MHNPVFEGSPESCKIVSHTGSTSAINDSQQNDGNLSDCLSQKSSASCDNLIMKEKDERKGTSCTETLMHMIKANIGTGLLAMPLAFKNAGILLGTFGLLFMGLVCLHCIHILLKAYKYAVAKGNYTKEEIPGLIGYDEVIYLMAKEKFKQGSKIPSYIRTTISIFLVIGQLGFCCVYFVFIPTNTLQVIKHYFPATEISIQILMTIVLGPMILYCMIRDLKYLAPFSTFANFLMISSVFVILYALFFDGDLKPFNQLVLVAPAKNWPTFFSTAVYAFEGIGCVLPVYHGMQQKNFFTPINGVLNTAMFMVFIMYYAIGFFGYLKYGVDCEASITLNLPVENIIFQSVKVCFTIAVFITYNLQFFVGCDIIWAYILRASPYLRSLNQNQNLPLMSADKKQRNSNTRVYYIIENVFRSLVIIFTFSLAIVVPRIDLFIALIGAIASSTLAIIVPIVLDHVIFWPIENHSLVKVVKNSIILVFGVYIFFAGTYTSLSDIFDYLKE